MVSETRRFYCWTPGCELQPSPVWARTPKEAAEEYIGGPVKVVSRGVDAEFGGRLYRTEAGVRVVVEGGDDGE